MSLGQRAKLICTPDYAYGRKGYPGVYPFERKFIFLIYLFLSQLMIPQKILNGNLSENLHFLKNVFPICHGDVQLPLDTPPPPPQLNCRPTACYDTAVLSIPGVESVMYTLQPNHMFISHPLKGCYSHTS